ncbi:hypothetical protein H0H92_015466 [Tricholoma furcatifolium]|nr:hypothetical protein H0H92_015466 [Tricholoma furcatifolium]
MDAIADQAAHDDNESPPQPSSPSPPKEMSKDQRALQYARRIMQKYPNVDRNQLLSLIRNIVQTDPQNLGQHLLRAVCDGTLKLGQPSAEGSAGSKRKGADEEQEAEETLPKRVKVDYGSRGRSVAGGPDYAELAVNHLHEDFSYIERAVIESVFQKIKLYAPAHLFLLEKQQEALQRSRMTNVPPLPVLFDTEKGKGKKRALVDEEFDRERKWLLEELSRRGHQATGARGNMIEQTEGGVGAEEEDRMVECGCCFSDYLSKSDIKCMSTDGCEGFFSELALHRALPEKQYILWERLNQRREIAAAGLALEDCPFCDFACVMADDQAPVITFPRHVGVGFALTGNVPFTQKLLEVRDEEAREGRHTIAEAMSQLIVLQETRALMRNCPKCAKPFIKDDGCNKITCPFCGTVSCYLCRKAIVGYNHFDSTAPGGGRPRRGRKSNGKCLLFDAVSDRHNDEVIRAHAAALEQVRNEMPDVEEDELQVELPPPPGRLPQPQVVRHPGPQLPPGRMNVAANFNVFPPPPAPFVAPPGPPVPMFGQPMMRNQPFAPQLIFPPGFQGVFGNVPRPVHIPIPMSQHLHQGHLGNGHALPGAQAHQAPNGRMMAPPPGFIPLLPPYQRPQGVNQPANNQQRGPMPVHLMPRPLPLQRQHMFPFPAPAPPPAAGPQPIRRQTPPPAYQLLDPAAQLQMPGAPQQAQVQAQVQRLPEPLRNYLQLPARQMNPPIPQLFPQQHHGVAAPILRRIRMVPPQGLPVILDQAHLNPGPFNMNLNLQFGPPPPLNAGPGNQVPVNGEQQQPLNQLPMNQLHGRAHQELLHRRHVMGAQGQKAPEGVDVPGAMLERGENERTG